MCGSGLVAHAVACVVAALCLINDKQRGLPASVCAKMLIFAHAVARRLCVRAAA